MQQLCDMMGNIITKQTLFKYEKGVMLPKSGIVIALCDALEINPDYLFSYKSSSPKNIRYGKLQGLSKREEMTIISIIENTIERTVRGYPPLSQRRGIGDPNGVGAID